MMRRLPSVFPERACIGPSENPNNYQLSARSDASDSFFLIMITNNIQNRFPMNSFSLRMFHCYGVGNRCVMYGTWWRRRLAVACRYSFVIPLWI